MYNFTNLAFNESENITYVLSPYATEEYNLQIIQTVCLLFIVFVQLSKWFIFTRDK